MNGKPEHELEKPTHTNWKASCLNWTRVNLEHKQKLKTGALCTVGHPNLKHKLKLKTKNQDF